MVSGAVSRHAFSQEQRTGTHRLPQRTWLERFAALLIPCPSQGEPGPEIGFIKIVGKVDSELFQLHNAYDEFNEAMFTEFESRGLQTRGASCCVEKLELYHGFHASEDERNRPVFTAFIHARHTEHFQGRVSCREDVNRNPTATKVLRDWNAQKEAIHSPTKVKKEHSEITEEDKAWEMPDAAKAEDVTKPPTEPPKDKAIRKDVPAYGPITSIDSLAEHVNDIVVQDADGKVSYQPPSAVELVDDGDYNVPVQSSMGRVIEGGLQPKAKVAPSRKTDHDEDDLQMYVDSSAPQGVAAAGGSLAQESTTVQSTACSRSIRRTSLGIKR